MLIKEEESMATIPEPAKAKGAQRVIEVLDFFDDQHHRATVMDIARRYNRPQSSTSELLASLVDLGLLYKDPGSRFYSLTPRAAIIGSLSQPRIVRDGRLAELVDTLRGQTGLGVALVGMVGANAQIFRWKPGLRRVESAGRDLTGGQCEDLCSTAAGWLLLSTLPPQRREGLIRRLNAEASEDRKFLPSEMSGRVQEAARRGYAIGPAGFGIEASLVSILLPTESDDRSMAIGFVYDASDERDPVALASVLQQAVRRCIGGVDEMDMPSVMAGAA
jgi:DNA-binding IclR family transcriptional regulator